MLNKTQHQLIMGQILKDIYTDVSISSYLGFKGDTCAYFFYELPRFSVDLDLDLLSNEETLPQQIFDTLKAILKQYGALLDARIKRHTIFCLLSYGDTDHNIKIEINIRSLVSEIRQYYALKEHTGISMLVGSQDYMFASKLVALSERKLVAMRDVYDIWFFGSQRWTINETVIKERTQKKLTDYLGECIPLIEAIPDNQLLQGLGELLDTEKDKVWVKNKLRQEALFILKNYQSALLR